MKKSPQDVSFPELETGILGLWEKEKTFHESNKIREGAPTYSFYDGPPFANGLPHYGHLLANTIKDTVPRYWNMRGYHVERRFGWDCHGLPVEYEIEKTHELKGRADILKMGVGTFNDACRDSVLHYTSEWQTTITRLGRWVDWDHQYRTMDRDFMESVWWVFRQLWDKGLVYRGHKVVPYSPRITAVLSNFEANQNYKDVQDPAIVVKFHLADEEASILAWTTTPWTLISNLALVVGEAITYVRIREKESGEIYYLARETLGSVYKPSKKQKELPYEILAEVSGKELVGRRYQPLFPYFADRADAFRIVADDYVTTEDGTGVVHTAPAYGEDDFRICRREGIELVDPLDEEARFTALIPEYEGQYVKDADKNIIRDLKARGQLLRHDSLLHSYPFCERTDEPLIYRAIPAWYVAVEKFRDELVAHNQKINWVPEHLKNGRMGKWLENARDWAVSRNRFWGTPLPVWVCDQDDQHRDCMGSIEELGEKSGVYPDDLHKQHTDSIRYPCATCGGTMVRVGEVFDCWFESGSMPYAQIHYPFENQEKLSGAFPADFIAEGLDQTRGWFYTLSVLSGALFKGPAFRNVVVNGMVLAKDGRKMSKRWRNYTPPLELIDQFGADSVRLYMLNSAILRGEDLRFSNEGVRDTTRAVLLPLWNAFSFLTTYAEADGWQPGAALAAGGQPRMTRDLDRWILSRFQSLVATVEQEMEAYRLYNVVPAVLGFIEDLTNWYIRLNRRRFWGGEGELSEDSVAAYETLYAVLTGFVKVFAPFAPFLADRIYRDLMDGQSGVPPSVHLCDMPVAGAELTDKDLEKRMGLIRTVTDIGRSLRARHQLRTRQVLPGMLVITRNDTDRSVIDEAAELINSELNIKQLTFSSDEARYVKLTVKPNLRVLGKRLGKDLKGFRQELERLNQTGAVGAILEELDRNGQVEIQGHKLEPDDLLVERSTAEGDDRLIGTSSGVTVLLDATLTEDLILEGLAREVVNRIQSLRKDSRLNVTDRIAVTWEASEKIGTAMAAFNEYIAAETLASRISQAGSDGVEGARVESWKIGDLSFKAGITVI